MIVNIKIFKNLLYSLIQYTHLYIRLHMFHLCDNIVCCLYNAQHTLNYTLIHNIQQCILHVKFDKTIEIAKCMCYYIHCVRFFKLYSITSLQHIKQKGRANACTWNKNSITINFSRKNLGKNTDPISAQYTLFHLKSCAGK